MAKKLIFALFSGFVLLLYASEGPGMSIVQDKPAPGTGQTLISFKDSIAPLLKANCSPCHFEGGKVYDRLPFERYETVRKLGKKLNTRLKDEKAGMVSRWIEQGYQQGKYP